MVKRFSHLFAWNPWAKTPRQRILSSVLNPVKDDRGEKNYLDISIKTLRR
jgi:hypothetical protein